MAARPDEGFDFATLMQRYRAADPDRRGLDLAALRQVVGPGGAARLDDALAGVAAGGRVSVVEFVPIACELGAAHASSPARPNPPPPIDGRPGGGGKAVARDADAGVCGAGADPAGALHAEGAPLSEGALQAEGALFSEGALHAEVGLHAESEGGLAPIASMPSANT